MRTTMKREFLEIASIHGLAAGVVVAFFALVIAAEFAATVALSA